MSEEPGPEPITSGTRRADWGIDSFEIAISLGGASDARDWKRSLEWVQSAEALGLHSVWLPEMHFAPGSSSAPLLALAGYAARTQRLRLGTTSLLLPIHHPIRLAEAVSALDRLSRGRMLVGLGRGFRPQLFAGFGIDPTRKRDLFDESLDLMLSAWSGQPVSPEGTPFEGPADTREAAPVTPLQRPHPPLAVAAFGRKGLTQAARRGLPYIASPLESLALLEENHRFHREQLPEQIQADALVVPILRTVHVGASDEECTRVLRGLEDESRAITRRAPKALARAAQARLEDRVVVGTHSSVLDQLAGYRERIGLDLLIVRPQVSGATNAQCHASLERLRADVLPEIA